MYKNGYTGLYFAKNKITFLSSNIENKSNIVVWNDYAFLVKYNIKLIIDFIHILSTEINLVSILKINLK